MKFLLDMGLAQSTAHHLRTNGHDAVHLRDQVEVDCWCARIGSKSFDLHYAVFTVQNKVRQLCTQGRSVMVAMDYTANAAINLPEAWRADLLRMLQPMEG